MEKIRHTRICKYDGSILELLQAKPGETGFFAAPSVSDSDEGLGVNMTWGYTFRVFECLKCTYIELSNEGVLVSKMDQPVK